VRPRIGLAALCAALLTSGCLAVPLGRRPAEKSRRHLVVGLFPAIGEAHLNHRATNGEALSLGLRVADYTLRPLYIAAVNFVTLGFPTLTAWLLEPYEAWSPSVGPCRNALLGFCKAAKRRPAIPEDEPGLTQRSTSDDDRARSGAGGTG